MSSQWQGDRRTRNRETGWLDVLIEALEEAELMHRLPCDERLLSLVRDRLESPSVLRARQLLDAYDEKAWTPHKTLSCEL